MVVYLINPEKAGRVFLHCASVWDETSFEVIAVSSAGKGAMPLGKPGPLGASGCLGQMCPAKPHRQPSPARLCRDSVERVSRYKAKIY